MSPDEQKRLGAFLKAHSQHSVKSYLGLKADFNAETSEAALETRRVWAQAQQTNPKFQDEAIWILSNLGILRQALTIPPEELLWLDRAEQEDSKPSEPITFYEELGVSRHATSAQINDAHRLRYRDARHLKNRHEAHQIYAVLDEVWRVLGDPALKKEYDAQLPGEIKLLVSDTTRLDVASIEPLSEKKALTDAPLLSIRGNRQFQLTVTKKVARRKIRIEKDGPGLVDATIRTDQPWLTANPVTLDPHATGQDIHFEVIPAKMAGRSALGQIVIQNFNGQRIAVHVKVTRVWMDRARIAIVLFAALSLFGALFLYPPTRGLFISQGAETIQKQVLILDVKPGPAKVTINDQSFEPASVFRIHDLSADRPLMLTVEKAGFERFFQRIEMKPGQELTIKVSLKQDNAQKDR